MQELTGKPNPREAIRLLGEFTRGRFDVWMLAGNHNAGNRAILLSQLTGIRQPQSKAGVNALRDAYYSALQVTGDCLAAKQDDFEARCLCINRFTLQVGSTLAPVVAVLTIFTMAVVLIAQSGMVSALVARLAQVR